MAYPRVGSVRQLSGTIGHVMLLLWCAIALVSCAHSPKTVPGIHLTLHISAESAETEESLRYAQSVFSDLGCPLVLDRVYQTDLQVLKEEDRRAVAWRVAGRRTLPVLIVQEIAADVDDASDAESYRGFWWRLDRGLWWRINLGLGAGSLHTIALSAQDAQEATLAHEIGHALGLDHTLDPDNIMCALPCERNPRPTFTDRQKRKMRSTYRSFKVR